MTQSEKERAQYLLTQLVEGESTEGEKQSLYAALLAGQDDPEWESILEELMISEPEQEHYDRATWDVVVQDILSSTRQEAEASENDQKVTLLPGKKRWLWIASVAAMLIIAFSLWMVLPGNNKSLIRTKYAEQKKVRLPDETEIVLNSNSTLTYLKRWENGQPREVWLKGEALFRVTHVNTVNESASAPMPFVVHTSLVNIEVLGTVFNVRERRGKTEIVLEKGKIKVSFIDSIKPDIIMQPGQILTIAPAAKAVRVNTIETGDYTAWTKRKLVLTDASFQQIVEYMEDNFGKKIILTDPRLANRKVEGTFKMDNMDDALLVLSKALNVQITTNGDTLIFNPQ